MKTICLLVIGVSLSMQWSFGQASYRFANYSSSFGIDAPVYDWDGELLSGSTWRFELYGGATQDSLSPVVPLDGDLNRAIIPLWRPGYFRADLALDGNPILVVPDVPGSGWAWLQVKAWDVGLGSTYEEAVAKGLGGYGQSMMFYAQGGYPTAPLPTLPFPLTGLQSFSVLQTIPEPSLWTLLALGSVLALRGRGERSRAESESPWPRHLRARSTARLP